MKYVFVNGRVAIIVRYWVQKGAATDGGARVELRRVDHVPGRDDRPGTAGLRIGSVGDGGIWRADLFMVLSEPGRPVFHFHPNFEDGDVGERYELPELDEDPRRWIADQLDDITGLLQRSGAGELAPSVDLYEHRQAMPHIMSAVDSCLARVPAAIGLSYAAAHGAATA